MGDRRVLEEYARLAQREGNLGPGLELGTLWKVSISRVRAWAKCRPDRGPCLLVLRCRLA